LRAAASVAPTEVALSGGSYCLSASAIFLRSRAAGESPDGVSAPVSTRRGNIASEILARLE
jgi:hypothetical protein